MYGPSEGEWRFILVMVVVGIFASAVALTWLFGWLGSYLFHHLSWVG